jgi:predicted NBD/HSP70 family sugar kinase
MSGNIIEKTAHLFDETTTPAEVAEFFNQFIDRIFSQYQLDPEKVPGIGVSVEGPILREKGIIYHPYHLPKPGWDMVPFRDLLELKTGHAVWLDCIVESALMGELVYGQHKGCTRAAYLRIDKGIGCAVYSHGAFGAGNEDFGNSLGHSVIDFQGSPCVCGRKGCLETYASMDSIVAGLQRIKPDIEIHMENAEYTDERQVWEYASLLQPIEPYQSSVEPEILHYFEKLAEVFAAAILNFLYFTRPRVLFLAGRTVKQLPAMFENVIGQIQRHYDQNFMQNIQVVQSELDDVQIIKGASFLVINNYIEYFGKGGG